MFCVFLVVFFGFLGGVDVGQKGKTAASQCLFWLFFSTSLKVFLSVLGGFSVVHRGFVVLLM